MTSFSELMQGVAGQTTELELTPDWLQGRTAHGGLTAALCVEAALRQTADLPPLRSAQFAFLGPAVGKLTITPTVLRAGKSMLFAGVDIVGEAGPAVRSILSFGVTRPSALDHEALPRPKVPQPDACPAFFQEGRSPNFAVNFDCRLAAGPRPLTPGATPQMWVWARHQDPQAHRSASGLIALADAIPPAAIILFPAPAPFSTATWSMEMLSDRPDSPTGWWLIETRADTARDGYSSQSMTIWDAEGHPVITARQNVAVFA